MSFLLPNPLPGAAIAVLGEACVASVGYHDLTPSPTTVRIADGLLVLTRPQNESGYLLVPWLVEPFGTLVVATTTLREREEPYRLLVELARGKLNQVRTQTSEWQSIGLRTSPEFERAVTEATRLFGLAVLNPTSAEADSQATRVLEQAYALADRLARDYTLQLLTTRHKDEGPLDTQFAARFTRAPLGAAVEEYGRAFNAASVGLCWRDIEPNESQYDWTQADAAVAEACSAGLPVTIGPVIDLAPGMIPTWAAGWATDLPTLAACMCDFLETAINRYKGDVRRWVVCAGFNHADALGLVDDDRLRLAFRLFEAAAQVDSSLELILSVAQPWGEYLVSDDQTISPLTFPDDLVRAGVRLSAVELEVRAGGRPRGSQPRDLLDTARLLDVFGMLGLPLEVVFSQPSSDEPDCAAVEHGDVVWKTRWGFRSSPESQAEWGASCVGLALCWPQVRTVTWDNWSDSGPHLVPHSGLLDSAERPKPLLARLRALRSEHLAPEL